MREKKFTPGPWHSCHKGKCTCKMVWAMDADHPVANIEAGEWGDTYPAIKDGKPVMESIPYGSINEETAIANANLIAAAPELLEALEEARADIEGLLDDLHGHKIEDYDGYKYIESAIKKAYGETE